MIGRLTEGMVFNRSFWLCLLLALVALAADQLVKLWVVGISGGDPMRIELLPFLNLVMAWNRGVSFGFLHDSAVGPWPLLLLAVGFSAVLLVWMARAEQILLRLALALMIGGAMGNGIDRVRWEAVADYIDFFVGDWHFWAFNLADAFISIGAALLIADSLFRRES